MPLSFHLFGPVSIHMYGVFIVLGLGTLLYALRYDRKCQQLLTSDQLFSLTTYGILGGIFGGKLLYLLEFWDGDTTWIDELAFWQGGFSILGTILGIALVVIWFVRRQKIPFLALADRITLYTPLAQSIARIGCFFAGCCHGIATHSWIGVTYTDPASLAVLHTPVHPTQLYSAALLLLTFVILYTLGQKVAKKPGQLVACYLILMSFERFCVDFLRQNRTLMIGTISLMQLIAGGVAMIGLALMYGTTSSTFLRLSRNKRSS